MQNCAKYGLDPVPDLDPEPEREPKLFMYRRPTLYPLEIAVDFLKSP